MNGWMDAHRYFHLSGVTVFLILVIRASGQTHTCIKEDMFLKSARCSVWPCVGFEHCGCDGNSACKQM